MGVEETVVDIISIDDFARRLQARIDQAQAALTMLTTQPATQPPALGGFHDAQLTAGRHDARRHEFAARLRRLLDALTATQAATWAIAERYRTAEARNHANMLAVGQILDAPPRAGTTHDGGEMSDGDRHHG